MRCRPHFAESYNCSHVGCPRMIFSFAGDNARYADGKRTGLIPLYSNQTGGAALTGAQFPLVFPEMVEEEWSPGLIPTYGPTLSHQHLVNSMTLLLGCCISPVA